MSALRIAAVQLRSSRTVAENIAATEALVREAAAKGATYVLTPEMTNILERSKADLLAKITTAENDPTVARLSQVAKELGITVHLGSLAVKLPDGKIANRGFILGPDGSIVDTYDKIHMFDVDLDNGESWRESATYTPGQRQTTFDVGGIKAGAAICYDLRFPYLFRDYAKAGVGLLTLPAAFTRQTGEAHWHILLRARAIENGAYVIAAAQGGVHEDGRETYGHSLIIDPWGRIVAEADNDVPGVVIADLDPSLVAATRAKVPSLANERTAYQKAGTAG